MVDLRTEIAGVALRNPTMLASGFLDETGGSMGRVYQAGAGAVVTKSVGPQPREGYPNPTIVELDAGLLNAAGLPNPVVSAYEHSITRTNEATKSKNRAGRRKNTMKIIDRLANRSEK